MRWYSQKCFLQSLARNEKKRTHISTLYFTLLPHRPCEADFYHFSCVGSYRRHNHRCQTSSRLLCRLGAMGAQNLGFPTDFDRRPYKTVIKCLHEEANMKQTSSKLRADVMHVYIQCIYLMFASCLLHRVKILLCTTVPDYYPKLRTAG